MKNRKIENGKRKIDIKNRKMKFQFIEFGSLLRKAPHFIQVKAPHFIRVKTGIMAITNFTQGAMDGEKREGKDVGRGAV
ncbi:hypothetical protein [Planococcus salinarum]|uniref:hypothetical protein n=1 Tax=Planococcus salinarum TaxID=622695 RepID=UPI00163D4718|nr:hypothetical protein [Planococcus salinarum]